MNRQRRLVIEKIADSVRKECNVTNYGIQNIFDDVEKIGYEMIRYPIGEDSFSGFCQIKNNGKIIFSNSSLILSREIFSVAHELGHHRLHLTETGLTLIKDDDFNDRDEFEIEANYFAACFLMPQEKVYLFIRYDLNDKSIEDWNGLDIARFQTEFNVSYDMALYRLNSLKVIDNDMLERLKVAKFEYSATKLLNAIKGNIDLCRATNLKKVPVEYLEWVIMNYNEKLIPIKSLEYALNYVDLKSDDLKIKSDLINDDDLDDFDDLLGRMD